MRYYHTASKLSIDVLLHVTAKELIRDELTLRGGRSHTARIYRSCPHQNSKGVVRQRHAFPRDCAVRPEPKRFLLPIIRRARTRGRLLHRCHYHGHRESSDAAGRAEQRS